ncbi:MAG: insulinase family protein [candidate division Zixibacteria bacterium]|nr:insulinase family protein [candidate division Zixibacteria bacterium]
MSNSFIEKTVMKNGLRVVTESLPTHHSVALGVWVDVGSRYEPDAIAGTSHFLEHMVFKGTPSRNAADIALYLERLGGVLNAFTSREHTCYHARVLDEHLPEAVSLLGDIVSRPTLPSREVVKERGVICEEIKDTDDTPNEAVHDLYTDSLWPGHAIGRPIMGSLETVSSMTRKTLADYRRRHYTADRLVVSASGGVSHKKLLNLLKKNFEFPDTPSQPVATESPNGMPPKRQVKTRKINQTHVCLGVPTWAFRDERRYPLLLANSILGGGMSSRLFQTVREKRGLVYTIFAFHDFMSDTGHFGVYFACDPKQTVNAIELTLKELGRMATKPVTATELDNIKSQLKGNMVLGLESTQARMHRLARHELYLGEHIPVEQTMKAVDRVTGKDIVDIARQVFSPDQLALSIVGPITDEIFDHIDWSKIRPKGSRSRSRSAA